MDRDGSENTTPDSHPNEAVLRVLSDMARLYDDGNSDQGRNIAASRKLSFYAARTMCLSSVTLRVLADEVLARSKSMVLEFGGGGSSESFFSTSSVTTPVRSRIVIEEL